jgi:small subunit ribosomal protein S23
MGGRNKVATQVYEAATRYLDREIIKNTPPWYTTIGSVPPSEILTRTQPPQHRARKVHPRARKPSKLFRPLTLEYEEDELRKDFYRDHPWELARPRIVLENDGKDGLRSDWSRIQQRGRPLNGER